MVLSFIINFMEHLGRENSAAGRSKSWVGKNLTGPFVDDMCGVAGETFGPVLSAPVRVPLYYGHRLVEGVIGGVGRALMNVVPGILEKLE